MNKENTEKLFTRFKSFFHPELGMQDNLMCFGFECGNGWFGIIWNLCESIEPHVKNGKFKVTQVKEKFGTLRFYCEGANDEIHSLIGKAELLSASTCEQCGDPGKSRSRGGWYSTVCDTCAKLRDST